MSSEKARAREREIMEYLREDPWQTCEQVGGVIGESDRRTYASLMKLGDQLQREHRLCPDGYRRYFYALADAEPEEPEGTLGDRIAAYVLTHPWCELSQIRAAMGARDDAGRIEVATVVDNLRSAGKLIRSGPGRSGPYTYAIPSPVDTGRPLEDAVVRQLVKMGIPSEVRLSELLPAAATEEQLKAARAALISKGYRKIRTGSGSRRVYTWYLDPDSAEEPDPRPIPASACRAARLFEVAIAIAQDTSADAVLRRDALDIARNLTKEAS